MHKFSHPKHPPTWHVIFVTSLRRQGKGGVIFTVPDLQLFTNLAGQSGIMIGVSVGWKVGKTPATQLEKEKQQQRHKHQHQQQVANNFCL